MELNQYVNLFKLDFPTGFLFGNVINNINFEL